jgi:hypothetical protein
MATAHLLADRFQPKIGLDTSTVSEMYHVTGITNWTAGNTELEVFGYVNVSIGQAHPDIKDAICVDKGLYRKISNTDALVYVYYTSRTSDVRRYRSSSTRGFSGSATLPIWTLTTGGRYQYSSLSIPRETPVLMETRIVRNGSLNDSARATMQQLVGSVFIPPNSGGIPYRLQSPSIVDFAPGQSRLVYSFKSSSRLLGLPVGTIIGQDIAVPALDYLQEWHAPLGGNGTPLAIRAIPWQVLYNFSPNSSLPFLL